MFWILLQWYRNLRGPPLYSGLGDCPNNPILSLPSPKRCLPPYIREIIQAKYDVAHRSNSVFFLLFTRVRGIRILRSSPQRNGHLADVSLRSAAYGDRTRSGDGFILLPSGSPRSSSLQAAPDVSFPSISGAAFVVVGR